ncbi:MAG TPA: glycerol-3-phosphate dehydrogenase [Stellaceae bacterium]|nr:glycerol-3-phosphate dehydrogenase [Stellaceae bacterium]
MAADTGSSFKDRPDGSAREAPVDLLIVGAGINGAGIARDAAGRGLSVVLCEKDDIAQGTSSRSGKLVHGGLRYLEYYEFRLVREALIEREVLLRLAPHIIWPMRFVLPHDRAQRPVWLIRLGLLLYDHLGGRRRLPASRGLDLSRAPEGAPLKTDYARGFEYSDCWVDDARLVILNAKSAAEHGARILPRTECVTARRSAGLWLVDLLDHRTGKTRQIHARVLVNGAGPWVDGVLSRVTGQNTGKRVRLVKGSHIVVPKHYAGPQAYLLQNPDRRVIFVNPYEQDYLLIGTTDIPYDGEPDAVAIEPDEIAYLCGVANRYFAKAIGPGDVVHAFSGIRPLYDDATENPSAVTRDYVFDIDGSIGEAPLLSIFGGKITTYRKLAEHALERLRPFLPGLRAPWTANEPLPGGDMADADFDRFLAAFRAAHAWLPPDLARHYARLYGTRAARVVGDARRLADLGRGLGDRLYEAEIRYLVDEEWAVTAEDILWRRTKHGLHLPAEAGSILEAWLGRAAVEPMLRA